MDFRQSGLTWLSDIILCIFCPNHFNLKYYSTDSRPLGLIILLAIRPLGRSDAIHSDSTRSASIYSRLIRFGEIFKTISEIASGATFVNFEDHFDGRSESTPHFTDTGGRRRSTDAREGACQPQEKECFRMEAAGIFPGPIPQKQLGWTGN
ncbi:hypothetical protein VIGAN_11007100 [Vigna angularis var. angularis]|uniref:Uncharacterized protein n=1 Tax=Vigna angularis var. angularis TaxID=157739 RepID=A0A0S3T7H4_PHAAN|nr:hypothetical protein VIGAN_11007100 [Vigna angularis var. angularis]